MSTMRALPTAVLMAVMIGSSMGCGSDDDDDPDVSCTGTIPTYAEVDAFDKCTMCHSSSLTGSARNGAPADDNFDIDSDVDEQGSKPRPVPQREANETNHRCLTPRARPLGRTTLVPGHPPGRRRTSAA